MLIIVRHIWELDFKQLLPVYQQSNQAFGELNCRDGSCWEKLRCGEDFFRSSITSFLHDNGAMIAMWSQEGRTVSALRLEPYADGLLISCLETAPDAREKGYATNLLRSVILEFSSGVFYSHVKKDNQPSIVVHRSAGFSVCTDHARLLDGSVSHEYYTLCNK